MGEMFEATASRTEGYRVSVTVRRGARTLYFHCSSPFVILMLGVLQDLFWEHSTLLTRHKRVLHVQPSFRPADLAQRRRRQLRFGATTAILESPEQGHYRGIPGLRVVQPFEALNGSSEPPYKHR
jgi:hypothetical protein